MSDKPDGMTAYDLFPPLEPYASGYMPTDGVHTLYWEECGNPNGVPVVFLHGGPGAGAGPTQRRFFDPKSWRIIIFDQRGAGRSRPFAELRDNTTEHLIADMERLRTLCGIQRWHLFGGSWGSTLALAYAETYPDHCLSLTLRGIYLATPKEVTWFLYGMRTIFPEAWENFSAHIRPPQHQDVLAAYLKRLTDPDPAIHIPAARVWAHYERSCSRLLPTEEAVRLPAADDHHDLAIARIEAHYFAHNLFLPPTRLLDEIDSVRKIPAVIVHGRYDIVCPIDTAYELHRAWPEADFRIISDAGHSALEPGIRSALIEATERFKTIR